MGLKFVLNIGKKKASSIRGESRGAVGMRVSQLEGRVIDAGQTTSLNTTDYSAVDDESVSRLQESATLTKAEVKSCRDILTGPGPNVTLMIPQHCLKGS